VRFGKNGADVTGAAVRLARAVTGRDMLAYSGYHGHHDWSMGEPPMNAGIPEAVRDLSVRVPWPDIEALRGLLTTRAFACYVSEPWPTALHDSPPPDGYWQEVRRICDATGTLLVCDEMVSGFRMAVGGGAEVYGISPDIGCYGKAMGNGYAVSAIVTRWELAQRWERDVFFSTTHGAEQAGIAAATACMAIVRDEDVPRALAGLGSEIMQLPGVSGYPQRPALSGWTPEALSCLVREHRVLTQGYVNISLAMCEDTKARSLLLRALEATAPKREAAA
jgi:glutamate-1-semialdehyde aminotransferase